MMNILTELLDDQQALWEQQQRLLKEQYLDQGRWDEWTIKTRQDFNFLTRRDETCQK